MVDITTNFQFRFGVPDRKLSPVELDIIKSAVLNQLQDDDILALSGSLSESMPADFYVQLINLQSDRNIKIILDTSGPALKKAIKQKVCLVKPNQRELALLAGKEFLTTKNRRILRFNWWPLFLWSM